MSETSIHIRMNKEEKERFSAICGQLGLSMSAAVNLFMKAVIHQGDIPDELALYQPNDETLEAIEDVNHKRGLSGPYRTTAELWEALDA